MIAPIRPTTYQPNWQVAFLAIRPTINSYARFAFRHLRSEARAEAIQEVVANALVAFNRLLALGKGDLAYPSVLAQYAIRQVRSGRRVGGRLNIRDVSSRRTQSVRKITVERFDPLDKGQGGWEEIVVEDRKAGPAETAAARIDLAAWFASLARNKRLVAKELAQGETTGATARKFGLSDGRVSQLRRELEQSWQEFQRGARA